MSANLVPLPIRRRSLLMLALLVALLPSSTLADEPYGWLWLDYRGPNNQAPGKTDTNWVPEFGGDYLSAVGVPVVSAGLSANPLADGRASNPPYIPDDVWSYTADSVSATSADAAIAAGQFAVFSFTTAPAAPSLLLLEEFRLLNLSASYFGASYTSFSVQAQVSTVEDFSLVLAADTTSVTPLATNDSSDWYYFTGLHGTLLNNNTTYHVRLAYFGAGSSSNAVRVVGDDALVTVLVPEPSGALLMAMAIGFLAGSRRLPPKRHR